jgi:thiol:disulfide interchange protein DsbD
MVIFLSLGLGLAFPYLLLTAFPALRGFLPKPGAWMERFKQFLAFPMFATTVWLVWVLAQQGTVDQLALVLLGLVGLAMGLWLWRYAGRRPLMRLCAAVLLLVSFLPLDGLRQAGALTQASELSVVPEVFSPSRLESLRAEGKPVFVNATAAWCITCKVNERVALKTTAVQQAFAARGLTYLYADWTNENPDITAFLASFGRSGVPLYAYYPAGTAEPSLLPQLLTPDLVLDALDAADEARDQSGRLQ